MGVTAMIIEVIMQVLGRIQPRDAALVKNGSKKFSSKVSISLVILRFTEVISWLKETYASL